MLMAWRTGMSTLCCAVLLLRYCHCGQKVSRPWRELSSLGHSLPALLHLEKTQSLLTLSQVLTC